MGCKGVLVTRTCFRDEEQFWGAGIIETFDLGEQGNKGRFFRGTGILAPLRASEMLQLFVIMIFSSLYKFINTDKLK